NPASVIRSWTGDTAVEPVGVGVAVGPLWARLGGALGAADTTTSAISAAETAPASGSREPCFPRSAALLRSGRAPPVECRRPIPSARQTETSTRIERRTSDVASGVGSCKRQPRARSGPRLRSQDSGRRRPYGPSGYSFWYSSLLEYRVSTRQNAGSQRALLTPKPFSAAHERRATDTHTVSSHSCKTE